MIADSIEKPKFKICELRGGPHGGQSIRVPVEQSELTLHDGPKPHRYYRLGPGRVFHHEDRVREILGAGR